jgi:hypothetical protein
MNLLCGVKKKMKNTKNQYPNFFQTLQLLQTLTNVSAQRVYIATTQPTKV